MLYCRTIKHCSIYWINSWQLKGVIFFGLFLISHGLNLEHKKHVELRCKQLRIRVKIQGLVYYITIWLN